jgi:acyl-CoA reductase-like NAD-dependent aldehyde dehydrogenase
METLTDKRSFEQQGIAARADRVFLKQKAFFESGGTRSYKFRKEQLRKLLSALKKYENDFIEALGRDFSKTCI